MSDGYKDIAFSFWHSVSPAAPEPLTRERFEAMWDVMFKHEARPDEEFHHWKCPKITTLGHKACRCGGNVLETLLALEGSIE